MPKFIQPSVHWNIPCSHQLPELLSLWGPLETRHCLFTIWGYCTSSTRVLLTYTAPGLSHYKLPTHLSPPPTSIRRLRPPSYPPPPLPAPPPPIAFPPPLLSVSFYFDLSILSSIPPYLLLKCHLISSHISSFHLTSSHPPPPPSPQLIPSVISHSNVISSHFFSSPALFNAETTSQLIFFPLISSVLMYIPLSDYHMESSQGSHP